MRVYRTNKKSACFTGHRNLPKGDLLPLATHLLDTVIELTNRGITNFNNGGALGFDQLAAMAVFEVKKSNPYITLEMVLPHKEQSAGWDETQKAAYNHILEQADNVIYISEKYSNGCMAARNLRLIENSSVCVAYMTRQRTGTSQTVRFARERNLEIINLAHKKWLNPSDDWG